MRMDIMIDYLEIKLLVVNVLIIALINAFYKIPKLCAIARINLFLIPYQNSALRCARQIIGITNKPTHA